MYDQWPFEHFLSEAVTLNYKFHSIPILRLYGTKDSLQHYFIYIPATSSPIHAFSYQYATQYFIQASEASDSLLFHKTMIEKMVYINRGMNPVEMTISNPWTVNDQVRDQTIDLMFLNPADTAQ